jgi:hypothetical protein
MVACSNHARRANSETTMIHHTRKLTGATVVCVALILTAGCATKSKATAPRPAKTPAVEQASVSQVTLGAGRIASVDTAHRFVVVNFRGRTMPPIGSIFKVYRAGNPVGQIRTTEPTRAWLATADILNGELQIGDEVR